MTNYYIRINKKNVLNINNYSHEKLCKISKCIMDKIDKYSYDIDYHKIKNNLSIYINIVLDTIDNSEINCIIYDYGIDNSINSYKKNYKIINNINIRMLLYNLIYNNYFQIINQNDKNAFDIINSYIIAKKNRNNYIKKLIIKREGEHLVEIINNEINDDNAKLVLNKIVEKYINRLLKKI